MQITSPERSSGLSSAIKTVGIIGAGQMGHGIAQVMAHKAGLNVIVQDVNQTALDQGSANIAKSLEKFVSKEQLTAAEKEQILSRLQFKSELGALKDADLIVEAIVENEGVKTDLFKRLDALVKPSAILASNTSSISITRLASATNRPEQVIGMHFMNPVPLMKLV